MDAVGADQHVGGDAHAVVEPGLDAVALVGKADEPVAEMDALRREARGDDREQVGAVNGQMRRAVELLAARVERRPLQRAAVLPAPLVGAERPHGLAVERRGRGRADSSIRAAFGPMLMPPPTSVSSGACS